MNCHRTSRNISAHQRNRSLILEMWWGGLETQALKNIEEEKREEKEQAKDVVRLQRLKSRTTN